VTSSPTRPTCTTCYGYPLEDVTRMLRRKLLRGIQAYSSLQLAWPFRQLAAVRDHTVFPATRDEQRHRCAKPFVCRRTNQIRLSKQDLVLLKLRRYPQNFASFDSRLRLVLQSYCRKTLVVETAPKDHVCYSTKRMHEGTVNDTFAVHIVSSLLSS